MNRKKTLDVLFKSKVVILFIILCVGGITASKQPPTFVIPELFTCIARNSSLVLPLVIPVLAGMGLDFGTVIGAMAAQVAIFLTTYWGLVGIGGFLLTVVIATLIAIFFGFLAGKLPDHMKGAEVIDGLVLSYFAEGPYQLLLLFIFGGVIPLYNPTLMIATGVGVKNTTDLKDAVKYASDTVPMLTTIEIGLYLCVIGTVTSVIIKKSKKLEINWEATMIRLVLAAAVYGMTFVPVIEQFLAMDRLLLLDVIELSCAGTLIWQVWKFLASRFIYKEEFNGKKAVVNCVLAVTVYGFTYIPAIFKVLIVVYLSVMTYLYIAGLCFFNTVLVCTCLGQNMYMVGQSRMAANAAGINVDKTRIIAMIFSTMLAGWGQLIFLQNVETFSTYGAHTQVGQFAIVALLAGGAFVQETSNRQAILGIILLHTLFTVAPLAGEELLGDPAIGEHFRMFASYGVIAMALAMHARKKIVEPSTMPPSPAGALGGTGGNLSPGTGAQIRVYQDKLNIKGTGSFHQEASCLSLSCHIWKIVP